jgi:hypothetical protein
MNKYCNASDFTSIFIPRVFANITKERITHIVENVVPLGSVERIDIAEIDEKTNRVWVHFTHWYDTEFVNEFKKLLLDETKQAKIVYDDPWFWIVLKNTHRLANGLPKIRLDLEDGEIPKPEVVTGSSKSTVTFTTSSANPSKKAFGKYHWADVESDSDEDLSSLHPTVKSRPNSPNFPPPPPTYPNPYHIQHNQQYQIPPIYPPLFYNIPSQIPYFPQHYPCQQQYNYYPNVPIAPILPIPIFPREMIGNEFGHHTHIPHPVASWNGISLDEMYMDEFEDDIFLTETDYQEMLLELDDDDIYSDEDLYNMYLIEKEELALINQIGFDNDASFDYDMFHTTGTGFDEATIVFHEHTDALLKSDERSLDTLQPHPTSTQIYSSLDKFIRPIITFKNKINSSSSPRPLKMFASYKDMLVKTN